MPYKSKEAKAKWQKGWKQNHPDAVKEHRKTYSRNHIDTKPFVGVDGEGGNIFVCTHSGEIEVRHEYYLIRAGAYSLSTGKDLRTREILEFLCGLPNRNEVYVSYYFDYDVTMILRDLSDERLHRLTHREARQADGFYFAAKLDWQEFKLDYMPHKYLTVQRSDQKKAISIHDVGSFFQCSFVRALKRWNIGTEEERQRIAAGKSQRAAFGALTTDTIEYNKREIKLLEDLMTQFRSVCSELEMRPNKWEGPGYLATSLFRSHGTPRNKDLSILYDQELLDAAQASYYGGRFEISAVGKFDGPIYEYDIHSAYPYAMTKLPCLEHLKVSYYNTVPKNCADLYLAHGKYDSRTNHHAWASFPWRSKTGSICFPITGSGWYWSHEIERRMPWQKFKADRVIVFRQECNHVPFAWVNDLYLERLKLGSDSKGIALKLALNSLYGKMAQSIGKPVYSNPIWASLITSITRAKLLEGLALDNTSSPGLHVLMLATDALYSLVPLDLPLTDNLGDWSYEVHNTLHIVQPGVYFTDSNSEVKSRGINADLMLQHRDEFEERLSYFRKAISVGPVVIPRVEIPGRTFMGIRISLTRTNTREVLGQWIENPKEVSYDWSVKRAILPRQMSQIKGFDPASNLFLQLRKTGSETIESTRYSKEIGKIFHNDRVASGTEDSPDWMFELLGIDQ